MGIEVRLFIGDDIPMSKVKNASDLKQIPYRRLKTRFIHLGRHLFPWHSGLVKELQEFNPDVILCEGESHFIGYIQAIIYRLLFNRRVALMHWCFISLPGWPSVGGRGFRARVKAFFRNFFDAFVVYSSFSKECLLKLGQPSEKIFVATNVCDTHRFIEKSDAMTESVSDARKKLHLPERFTVLYIGELDAEKRPDVMLYLAQSCDREKFSFVLLGSGMMLHELRASAAREGLSNVFLPGRVVDELHMYYRASNVLLIPGRGGIVISEAMAFGLPVIVHEADGTEYDLVKNKVTGLHLLNGDVESFSEALEFLVDHPDKYAEMSTNSRQLVTTCFTTDNMVQQIIRAAHYAKNVKY
jgi:glycosyltransferase involved in cell wall biosynthesis